MAKALDGVRILDFTHVQSGPTCTQLLAWFGADVIKVERAGSGDVTREQLRDVPDADSLYFTMLNHNKRSVTIDTKNPEGKKVLETLIKTCDVLVENFAPGALDRMGFTWARTWGKHVASRCREIRSGVLTRGAMPAGLTAGQSSIPCLQENPLGRIRAEFKHIIK
jgi:hypothetical protein